MAYAKALPHTSQVTKRMLGRRYDERSVRGMSDVSVRSGRQSGSVIVELSFVLVPFLAMMLAIGEFAMPIFLQSTFNAAVREGVRFGVTYNTTYNGTGYSTQTDAIKAVVQANGLGFLQG